VVIEDQTGMRNGEKFGIFNVRRKRALGRNQADEDHAKRARRTVPRMSDRDQEVRHYEKRLGAS
jgi:hypothetical protein